MAPRPRPKDDFDLLMTAAKDNKHKELALLIASGVSPSLTNSLGQSALHVASMWGNAEAVQVLLDAGVDPSVMNQYDWTPLHYAAKNSKYECARRLLAAGADTGAVATNGLQPWEMAKEDEMRTLCCGNALVLHAAVISSDLDQVQTLVREGADLSKTDHDGFTALHLAIAMADSEDDAIEMVGWILTLGEAGPMADSLALAFAAINRQGYMPLHLAVAKGSAGLASALIESGAPINAQTRLRGAGYDGNWGKRDQQGKLEEVDNRHMTPLHLALNRLEKSAEDDDSDDDDGEAESGFVTSDDGAVELVKVLLNSKADVNARDVHERTPLHQAVGAGRHDVVQMLLDANAEPNAIVKGSTALHQAVASSDTKMLKLLLTHKENAGDNKSASAGVVDVNGSGRDGWTPLALAARSGNHEATKLLLEFSADPGVVMRNGKTALDIARINKKDSVVTLLGKLTVSAT